MFRVGGQRARHGTQRARARSPSWHKRIDGALQRTVKAERTRVVVVFKDSVVGVRAWRIDFRRTIDERDARIEIVSFEHQYVVESKPASNVHDIWRYAIYPGRQMIPEGCVDGHRATEHGTRRVAATIAKNVPLLGGTCASLPGTARRSTQSA